MTYHVTVEKGGGGELSCISINQVIKSFEEICIGVVVMPEKRQSEFEPLDGRYRLRHRYNKEDNMVYMA